MSAQKEPASSCKYNAEIAKTAHRQQRRRRVVVKQTSGRRKKRTTARDECVARTDALSALWSFYRFHYIDEGRVVSLDANAVREFLAATYRGARQSEAERAASIETIDVTLARDVLVFQRGSVTSGGGSPRRTRPY